MKVITILSALAALCMSGCKTNGTTTTETIDTSRASNVYAVVVGMETSRFAGECPGAGLDAQRMYGLLSVYADKVAFFKDRSATKVAVSTALREAIAEAGDGLVIFFYSGHGGSEPFPDTGKEEVDGSDEYLCLYDTYMRDNEIWQIIKESRGRVFLMFDCCHSQSMMREPGFRMRIPLSYDHTMTDSNRFSLLCWSGCPDNTYSYGSSTGGQFTNSLLRHFDPNKTYEYLWNEIKNDKVLRSFENPQSTVMGDGFTAKRIFR